MDSNKQTDIRVELGSSLRELVPQYDPAKGIRLKHRPDMTVRSLLDDLGISSDEVGIAFVNREAVKLNHALREGDSVGLFKTLVGG